MLFMLQDRRFSPGGQGCGGVCAAVWISLFSSLCPQTNRNENAWKDVQKLNTHISCHLFFVVWCSTIHFLSVSRKWIKAGGTGDITSSSPALRPYTISSNNINDPLLFSCILPPFLHPWPLPSFRPFAQFHNAGYFRHIERDTNLSSSQTFIRTLRVNPIGPLHVRRGISTFISPPQCVSSSCLWGWHVDSAFFPRFIRSM